MTGLNCHIPKLGCTNCTEKSLVLYHERIIGSILLASGDNIVSLVVTSCFLDKFSMRYELVIGIQFPVV